MKCLFVTEFKLPVGILGSHCFKVLAYSANKICVAINNYTKAHWVKKAEYNVYAHVISVQV